MKKTHGHVTVEQAKQVLPAWLELMYEISAAKLSDHPAVSGLVSVWTKYFVPVLEADFYRGLGEISTVKKSAP